MFSASALRTVYYSEQLQPTMAALQRRKDAGTLFRPTDVESEWFSKHEARRVVCDGAPAEKEGVIELVYDTFLQAASMAWASFFTAVKPISSFEDLTGFNFAFLASALDIIRQTTNEDGSAALLFSDDGTSPPARSCETLLVMMMIPENLQMFPAGVVQPLLAACDRLKASPALRLRGFAEKAQELSNGGQIHKGLLQPSAPRSQPQPQQPLPRTCHFLSCGVVGSPAKPLKRCGGCSAVFYCCKEHQHADWPAHKGACKAARGK